MSEGDTVLVVAGVTAGRLAGQLQNRRVGVVASIKERSRVRGGSSSSPTTGSSRRVPWTHWAPIHREHLLVTDTGATAEQLDRFTADLLATVETVEPLALTTAGR